MFSVVGRELWNFRACARKKNLSLPSLEKLRIFRKLSEQKEQKTEVVQERYCNVNRYAWQTETKRNNLKWTVTVTVSLQITTNSTSKIG